MATCNSGPAAHKPRLRVCVSDTHNAQPKLPNGEILIHAGDLTQSGSLQEIQKTVDWLRSQPHAIKIKSDANGDAVYRGEIIYLQDSEMTITCDNGRHLRIYGSPYSPRHGNWAFQYPRSDNVGMSGYLMVLTYS